MKNSVKFDDWKKEQIQKDFAQERLSELKDLPCIHGKPELAQSVMNICKPGQVQLAICFFIHELNNLKKQNKFSPQSIREHVWHLKMFAESVDENERFMPDMFPEILLESRNNWRVKHAILGTTKLMHLQANHLEDKMQRAKSAKVASVA